jgi:hypothetical protein
MADRIDAKLSPQKKLSKLQKQALFLASFSETANVLISARLAGVSRQMVYKWLEHDEHFSFAYNQAKEDANDVLRAEIYRRGVRGYDEQVLVNGKMHTVRKYSDTLLIFLAKARMTEFREKQTLDVNTNVKAVEIYKVRIPDNGRDTN